MMLRGWSHIHFSSPVKSRLLLPLMILFMGLPTIAWGQENVEFSKDNFRNEVDNWRRKLNDAIDAIERGDELLMRSRLLWKPALEEYQKAQAFNPSNAALNFKIGQCFLYSPIYKFKAISYFERAYQLDPKVHPKIHYFLGRGYHLQEKWDQAINEYLQYRKTVNAQDEAQTLEYEKVNKRIQEARTGQKLSAHPIRVWVDNLGDSINTKYPEYAAIINADESLLLFTSRRPSTTGGEKVEGLDMYHEDIYYSRKREDGTWTKATNFSENINTDDHDATVGISPDGQKLLVYKSDNGDGNIYETKKIDGEWTEPEVLHKHVSSKYYENSAWYSYDGKRLYFISTRPDGNMGEEDASHYWDRSNPGPASKDIWVSEWNPEKERWKEPENLGPTINTKYDEDGIFMHPDGKTLYFSSQGHNTMGGYDIFRSVKTDTGWSKPENIGYPINTPDNDVFFVVSASGRHAYYSSFKQEGQGEKDLYLITFLGPEKEPVLQTEDDLIASLNQPVEEEVIEPKVEVRESNLAILKGLIRNAKNLRPLKADIELTNNETGDIISETRSDAESGKYLISLPAGKNYGIAVKKEGYLFHSENFKLPDTAAYKEITKNIDMQPIDVGSKIILKNIFFDFDKATLRDESIPELKRVARVLEENSNIRIELSGHTDSRGSDSYNKRLSEKRAEAVVDYLVDHGIDKNRLESKGYGEEQPIATNETEEGRQKNRRTEFKIISK